MFDYQQAEENRAQKRLIKKEQEKKLKKTAKKAGGKIIGEAIIRWLFISMFTIALFPFAVIALDIYWFFTLLSGNLAKLGYTRGTILAGMNLILLPGCIIAFMMFYCTIHPVECGWEAIKSAVT